MSDHILIIGGTGMLRRVALKLNEQRYHVTVIARDPERLVHLKNIASHPEQLSAVSSDYLDREAFMSDITAVLQQRAVNKVVAWIHSTGNDALQELCNVFGQLNKGDWELFDIKGSRASRPTKNVIPDYPDKCIYREIILGFVYQEDDGHSRWLTHEEISEGVLNAVHLQEDRYIIGQIEPWDKRP